MNLRGAVLHKVHDKNTTWHTFNEKSGRVGVKWYCCECDFMMVFHKDSPPTLKSRLEGKK